MKIKELQSIVGIDTREAFRYLVKNQIMVNSEFNDKSRGRTVENLIALLLNKPLPGTSKGSDFSEFEVKTVQIKYTKKEKLIRTCGDTPISDLDTNDTDFKESNIWNKTKSLICVLVYKDIITDIRHLDGEKHIEQFKSDYESLFLGENNHRRVDKKTWRSCEGKYNKYFARKDYQNYPSSVMLIGNSIVDLSESICEFTDLVIDDQTSYIESILKDKIINRHEVLSKNTQIPILKHLSLISDLEELIKCRDIINKKLDIIYSKNLELLTNE